MRYQSNQYFNANTINMRTELQNKVFQYQGSSITFNLGNGDVMVNATEMARPFKKRPAEFLRLPQTAEFMRVMKENIPMGLTHRSENGVGTWMHQKLALKFAAWLSPEFELWCFDRIEEIMKTGVSVASPELLDQMIVDPEFGIRMFQELKTYREERDRLALESDRQKKEIERKQNRLNYIEPKAQLMDKVLGTRKLLDMKQAAKILNIKDLGSNKLIAKLREMGIFFKHRNEAKQEYINRGYFRVKESAYENPKTGKIYVSVKTLVTQKGIEYLYKKLNAFDCRQNSITHLH